MRLGRFISVLASVEELAGALLPDQEIHPTGRLSPLAGLVAPCLVGPWMTRLFGKRLWGIASGGLALALLLARCRQSFTGDACTSILLLLGVLAALALALGCPPPAPTSRAPNTGENPGVLRP
jgi:hypothetical protein